MQVRLVAASACVVVAGMLVSTAAAGDVSVFNFNSCVGPEGTPVSFDAVKTALPEPALGPVSAAGAFRLTDGTAVFVVLSFGEGNFSPPGIVKNGKATTTCRVGTTNLYFSGKFAPTH